MSNSRYRSNSAPFPVSVDNIPSISVSPSPEYQVLDILPTPITSPLTSNQLSLDDPSFLCDQITQLQWNISTSLSPNQQIYPATPTSPHYINAVPEYIIPTFNAGVSTHGVARSHLTIDPTTVEAKRRRRTQNREAQRKFRERKESYLKNLEEKAKRLVEVEKRCEELEKENAALKLRLQELESAQI
ncbi:hypothetical protein BKA69DRAFT_1167538 [Paraphysoderma sedebokerense]|nr:hypothetical protein BKA69DRAFT_1167538 [Paraphysoderma sedebokerense]